MPPVTNEELEILETKAGKGTLSSEGVARIGRNIPKDKNDMTILRLPNIPNMPKNPRDLVKEVPYNTARPHNPRKRFIRRIYQRLLAQIPIMQEISKSSTFLSSTLSPSSESLPKTNINDKKKNIESLPEIKLSDKKGLKSLPETKKPDKSSKEHPINPPDPNKAFAITKSRWANGRPMPLVKKIDRKGLNPEEMINQIGSGGKKGRSRGKKVKGVNVEILSE